MRKRIVLHKPIGRTPLEALEAWRREHPAYKDIPATYAGRLDPMASGKLLVLFGEECKKREQYLKLPKVYEIEVLLGIGTDTGDVLGVPVIGESVAPTKEQVTEVLKSELGTHTRAYPVFSSKTVEGKSLFQYALEGTLDTIQIPTHEEAIHSIKLLGIDTITIEALRERVMSLLALAPTSTEPSKVLGADFRIGQVRPAWEEVLHEKRTFPVIRLRVSCASGTYMRSLAERIGSTLGTSAFALSIRRTRIGAGPHFPFL